MNFNTINTKKDIQINTSYVQRTDLQDEWRQELVMQEGIHR